MTVLSLVLTLASPSAIAQELAPSNLAVGDFDGDRAEDLAIGSVDATTGCGEVGVWRSSDGPFAQYDRDMSPFREPSLSIVPSRCVAEFGAWLYLRRGSLMVNTPAGELTIDRKTLARARGTLVLDITGVTPPPPEIPDCDWLYVDGGSVLICADDLLPQCEACCGESDCCITNICE